MSPIVKSAQDLVCTSVEDARSSLKCSELNGITSDSVRILNIAIRMARARGSGQSRIALFLSFRKRWNKLLTPPPLKLREV